MNDDAAMKMLSGTIEVDETYVGGKPRKEGSGEEKPKNKRGALSNSLTPDSLLDMPEALA